MAWRWVRCCGCGRRIAALEVLRFATPGHSKELRDRDLEELRIRRKTWVMVGSHEPGSCT